MLTLACIILPPGHGKSFMHESVGGLLEADSIYDCRGDEGLKRLREEARRTGIWGVYDEAWAIRIKSRLDDGKYVIMVPKEGNAHALGAVVIGSAMLTDDEWARNLVSRGKTPAHYEYSRIDDDCSFIFDDRDDLTCWVINTAVAYLWERD